MRKEKTLEKVQIISTLTACLSVLSMDASLGYGALGVLASMGAFEWCELLKYLDRERRKNSYRR